MNKEQIYDAEIEPLVTKIIEIAKTHKIGMIACFSIPTEDDPDLMVSTVLPDEQDNLGKLPGVMGRMVEHLLPVAVSTAINPEAIHTHQN